MDLNFVFETVSSWLVLLHLLAALHNGVRRGSLPYVSGLFLMVLNSKLLFELGTCHLQFSYLENYLIIYELFTNSLLIVTCNQAKLNFQVCLQEGGNTTIDQWPGQLFEP